MKAHLATSAAGLYDALLDLREAAAASGTAGAWNDLGALHMLLFEHTGNVDELVSGLAALERALDLDPTHPEARFNRALSFQMLGIWPAATRAWEELFAAEGQGPVNALDIALRKDLGKYQSYIEDLKLVDYKVRIFQGGSDAVTRVLIEFQDKAGERRSTVGVSDNIIDASFQALTDSMTYKLLRSGAEV